ncbi:unnamed protein product [Didymodactylos carnosus]|uniref:ubiquitinyl hydrolase 1 n=1 Tax=Didymodactylos carnosus TaxID=1234261 RepID=A0A815ZF76_9BILA|nr:unnamed protein product [Didymodactylos carnosus]CAF4374993.1 unnamed protein product [Didymodactylos carnosus]CAF4450602.1 unnamed protein product [Didymodactylos carnosus]
MLKCKVGALLYEVRQQGTGAINPKDYFKEMKVLDPTFITGVQQDSDELLKNLYPKLIEDGASCARCKRHIAQSSSNSSDILQNLSTIDRVFGLQLNSALICENLATEYTIAVALSSNTIVGCLKNYFGMVELETPAVCDLCHGRSLKWKKLSISYLPNNLIVTLNRFDFATDNIRKILSERKIVEQIDINEYVHHSISTTGSNKICYNLYAVIVHKGVNCYQGHYYSYLKKSDEKWIKISDADVQDATFKDIQSDNKDIYILCYEIQSNIHSGINDTYCVL